MNDSSKDIRKRSIIPFHDTLEKAYQHLSFTERIIFYCLIAILIITTVISVFRLNDFLLVDVPVHGGSISEGVVGSPRFINPLFAITDADRDLTSLIYAGLLKVDQSGHLIPEMAESYSVSPDGLTYTFILKNNLTFHDGVPVTADDVEFTVLKAQGPGLKSPKRANWDSVKTERVGEREIRFILKQPYAPFLQNATMGILPKHIWKDVSDEEFALSFFNIEPIGSGPFSIQAVQRNASGIPERYVLVPFANYILGKPYIKEMNIVFYTNEDLLISAFKKGDIMSINSITPEKTEGLLDKDHVLLTAPLSRIFGVFFNQNQAPIFANLSVREALNQALDKQAIVSSVLSGFGVVADGPIPKGFTSKNLGNASTTTDPVALAKQILEKDGWKLNSEGVYEKTDKKKKSTERLEFSLSTANAPELKKAAEMVRDSWQKIGVKVDLKVFESGDLSQNVIRPRKYDALLFGEIVGRDLDLFAFWHSSQRNDPGLNIALYTNTKTDKLLADARTIPDENERIDKYLQFEAELKKDVGAIFLYSPTFIYFIPTSIHGIAINDVTVPSERFASVEHWYMQTEKIWKIFMSNRKQSND